MHGKQCVYCCACRISVSICHPAALWHTQIYTVCDSCWEMHLCDIVSWHTAVTDAAHWSGLFPPAQFAKNIWSGNLNKFTAVVARWTEFVDAVILILTFLTRVSSIAGQTKAEEWINLVDASASIFTWLGLAVINICEKGKKQAGCGSH